MVLANDMKFVDGVLIGAKGVGWDSKVIVMQYIGLKDKDHKEIFEDDIVRIYNVVSQGSLGKNIKPSGVKWVVFQDGCFGYYNRGYKLRCHQ